MRRIILIGDLHHALKTNDLGNVLVYHPDHVNGAANTNNGGGGFYLKGPFFEFYQVFCEHLEFSRHHTESGVSLLLFGIELKPVQMKIRLFTHGHVAAVFKYQSQS